MDLQTQKQLINEFLDFQIKGSKPFFNFHLTNGKLKSFNNIIDFLKNEPKFEYDEVYITPF